MSRTPKAAGVPEYRTRRGERRANLGTIAWPTLADGTEWMPDGALVVRHVDRPHLPGIILDVSWNADARAWAAIALLGGTPVAVALVHLEKHDADV